jgi:hypothetical protein
MKVEIVKYLLILICLATIGLSANVATAKSSDRVKCISQSVTIAIENQQLQEVGSGFIVQRQGDLYTIVTNRHVVCKIRSTQKCVVPPAAASYIVTTPDGQQHPVSATGIKILGTDVDLEIVQFPSPKPKSILLPVSKRMMSFTPLAFQLSSPHFQVHISIAAMRNSDWVIFRVLCQTAIGRSRSSQTIPLIMDLEQ